MSRFARQRPPLPPSPSLPPRDPPNLDYYTRPRPGRGLARTPTPAAREETGRVRAPAL